MAGNVIKKGGGGVIKKGAGANYSSTNAPATSRRPQPHQRPQHRNSGGVIQRDELEARNQYQGIIQKAYAEAEMIRGQAEEYRQKGYQDGYQEGFEEGKSQITETLLRLEQNYKQRLAQTEPDLVRLSVQIAEKLIGAQLQMQPDLIVQIVGKALTAVRHQREIFLRVNPADYEVLTQHKPQLLDYLSRAQDIDIRSDSSIAQGSCIVESEIGTIEAVLEKQLVAFENALLG